MNSLHEIEALARELMNREGLHHWKFGWNKRKRGNGLCNHTRRTIELSSILSPIREIENVKNTILHEIAHALTPGHHHDHVWRKKAIELGCTGERCSSDVVDHETLKPNYIAICQTCKKVSKKYRKPTRQSACGACCKAHANNKFDKRFILTFVSTKNVSNFSLAS